MVRALALAILLALGGCEDMMLYCGPGAGDSHARDMLHGMCSEW